MYGADRVAVFASPNTDCMGREQTQFCAGVGRIFAPSQWCARTVWRSASKHGRTIGDQVRVVPLGVSPAYLGTDDVHARRGTRTWVAGRLAPRKLLHVATDHAWPGRKGTEELIGAWAMVAHHPALAGARLTIHAPRGVYEHIHYLVAHHKVFETVDIEFPQATGSPDDELAKLYADHDLLVLPPRCEGYGMMILAGLMNEIPLVTVRMTGQEDFLGHFAGWTAVPVGLAYEPLAYEEGLAPVVDTDHLATTLVLAASGYGHLLTEASKNREEAKHWTWPAMHVRWVEAITEWTEETE